MEKSRANCILVGFVVVFLILTLIGLFNGMMLMGGVTIVGVSIICTLGVSLVLWVPLWWLTGWIVLTLWPGQNKEPAIASIPPNLRPLITYLQQARSRGYSDDQIQRRLHQEGWDESDITTARQHL
jgi:hypothetical protein